MVPPQGALIDILYSLRSILRYGYEEDRFKMTQHKSTSKHPKFLRIFVVFPSKPYNDPFSTAYFKEVGCVTERNMEMSQSILRHCYRISVLEVMKTTKYLGQYSPHWLIIE